MDGQLSNRVLQACEEGRMLALLHTLPRARWTECDGDANSLLHYACQGDNVAAVVALLMHGLDVNALNAWGGCAAHYAAHHGEARTLEVLCAAGANVNARSRAWNSPLAMALACHRIDCARVLLANGARVSLLELDAAARVPALVRDIEHGVAHCRRAARALVCLKRYRRCSDLRLLDRWVVLEVAVAVWATRAVRAWQQ